MKRKQFTQSSASVEIPGFTKRKWKTFQPIFALTDEI